MEVECELIRTRQRGRRRQIVSYGEGRHMRRESGTVAHRLIDFAREPAVGPRQLCARSVVAIVIVEGPRRQRYPLRVR